MRTVLVTPPVAPKKAIVSLVVEDMVAAVGL